jgi:hypothetical protein
MSKKFLCVGGPMHGRFKGEFKPFDIVEEVDKSTMVIHYNQFIYWFNESKEIKILADYRLGTSDVLKMYKELVNG